MYKTPPLLEEKLFIKSVLLTFNIVFIERIAPLSKFKKKKK